MVREPWFALFAVLTLVVASYCASSSGREGDIRKPAQPADPSQSAEEDEDELDELHDAIESYVYRVAQATDRFFGNENDFSETNETTLRLRTDLEWVQGNGIELQPKLRFQLRLPAAERKLKLIITAGDNPAADNDFTERVLQGESQGRQGDLSAAVQLIQRDDRKLRRSFDLGVRVRDWLPAVYGRFYVRRQWLLDEEWGARVQNALYLFSDINWENDFRIYFARPFGSDPEHPWLFRSLSRARWVEDDETVFVEQNFSFFNRLSRKQAIAYEWLNAMPVYNYSSQDREDISTGLRIRWRTNVKYPWLFFELWPALTFPESEDFQPTWTFLARAEIYFGPKTPQDPVRIED